MKALYRSSPRFVSRKSKLIEERSPLLPNSGGRGFYIKFTKIGLIGILALILLFGCDEEETEDEEKKTLNYEYDRQNNGTERSDLFAKGTVILRSAFNKANTSAIKHDDQVNLVSGEVADYDALVTYVKNNYNLQTGGPKHTMYLLGIDDVTTKAPELPTTTFAFTFTPSVLDPDNGGKGTQFGATVIFWDFTYSYFQTSPYNFSVNEVKEVIEHLKIHEFGHQRRNLPHFDPSKDPGQQGDHTQDSDCVMVGNIPLKNNKFAQWYDFCDVCVGKIKTVNWDPNY
jgi:hypothetical protein